MMYRAHVFGKHGCAKCEALKRRLAKLLEEPKYADVEMVYHDILTEAGIVEFCKADCINPNRIPALVMERIGDGYIEAFREDTPDVYADSVMYNWVGIQTDYDKGGGLITPATIQAVLDEALASG